MCVPGVSWNLLELKKYYFLELYWGDWFQRAPYKGRFCFYKQHETEYIEHNQAIGTIRGKLSVREASELERDRARLSMTSAVVIRHQRKEPGKLFETIRKTI